MFVRNPGEVDDAEWYPLLESGYHSGSVGPLVDAAPDDSRRKIGFFIPEKEQPLPDPSWLLI